MASGIKDKVAILGMGCAKFGERWDHDADALMVEAFEEAIGDGACPFGPAAQRST
jgi:acetyl-CoA C-acetyltransferase